MLQINVGFFHIKHIKTCLAKSSHFRKVKQLTDFLNFEVELEELLKKNFFINKSEDSCVFLSILTRVVVV
jgi:hypothetical protein